MRTTRAFPILALLALTVTAPSWAATATDVFEREYDFRPGGSIQVGTTNGNIEITTWDRSVVAVRAVKKARATGERIAEDLLERTQIEIEAGPDRIEITTRLPRREGLGWLFRGPGSASVRYELRVPREVSLDLTTVNGKIRAHGAHGTLEARTTNGSIDVVDAAGSARARTTNGAIDVELKEVDENADLRFASTNGGIRVTLPETIAASVEASTTNGSITTDFPIRVQGRLNRRRLNGEINGGGGRLELRTTNGPIEILEF